MRTIGGIAARFSGEPHWAEWILIIGFAPVLLAVVIGTATRFSTAKPAST
jgi:hypothetical protein